MTNKGQADSLHIGLLLFVFILVVALGAIFWYLLTAPSTNNKIAPGATQTNVEHHEWPFAFTCTIVKPEVYKPNAKPTAK